ncbi:MAG: 5'-nucleotidase C-terminal domain-containing protein [Ruminiclostridium sp.]|nr:5'-nucleotidase C-terminal domain-containing protein [Ruminiclostridium sp.]
MKKLIRIAAAGTALVLASAAVQVPVYAEDSGKSDDIVILYTNDVHCGIDVNIGYDGLALYKREMQAQYENVLVVDAGDAIQGMPVGTLSKGAYITRLMNAVGYDAATLGNHEFDYSLKTLQVRAEELDCGYVSANFYNKETGKPLFDAYKIIEAGDKKIAFVGATTPETLSGSTPIYFQNDAGEYIYGFGEDGSIYELLQTAVDDARDDGADYVILLAHLGENYVREGWSAQEVVAELTGVDAVIDGHSHEVTPGITVKSKDGKDVVITQTGTKFANIGKMTITTDGRISTELINSVPAPDENSGIAEDTWLEPDGREGIFVDEAVNREMMMIESEYSDILDEKIGTSDYDLFTNDPETGDRLVRNHETNLGDLCADAYKYVLEADVGIVNGGGVRAPIKAGDITYKDAMAVFPFANMALVAEVTGQQILDILEEGAMYYPGETGSFIHVSGIEYTIDEGIPSSVKLDETATFLGVDGEYRVKNVLINGEPLDTSKTYTLASHNYYLKNGGDGYVFTGKCNIIRDNVMSDSDLIAVYIRDNLGGVIPEQYSELYGEGRIKFINSSIEGAADEEISEEPDNAAAEIPAEDTAEETAPETPVTTEQNPTTGVGITVIVPAVCLIAAGFARKRK